MGLGQLGLTPSSLYDMTFAEFGNAMRGLHEIEEMRQRAEWERTRWLACLLLPPLSACLLPLLLPAAAAAAVAPTAAAAAAVCRP